MIGQQKSSRNLNWFSSIGVAVACTTGASAQTDGTYLITFDGVITPQNPTMTVGIWATWVSPDYLFGGGDYDLEASEGEFTGGTLMLGNEPPNKLGDISGRWVTGAAIGQLHGILGIWGDESNPILLAEYDWTTTDFTPRTINFDTRNTDNFVVTLITNGSTKQLFPDEFTPGSAQYFVPAPSTLALLACGGLVATRRQRMRNAINA